MAVDERLFTGPDTARATAGRWPPCDQRNYSRFTVSAAPPRSFPTRSIAASPFPITSAPIVIATRSRARSAASRTRAASLPVTAKAPGTSSAPSAWSPPPTSGWI